MEAAATVAEEFGVFDFGLSEEQEQRAARLHAESIVIDLLFQGPCGNRAYAGLDLPPPTGDHEKDFDLVSQLPTRKALAGELDEFEDCGAARGSRRAMSRPGGFRTWRASRSARRCSTASTGS